VKPATLPTFLCIGAQKAGTSWLFAQLQSHPDVWMPPVKELQYFNHLYVPEHRAWTTWHIRQGTAQALAYHVGKDGPPDFGYVRYLADLASREPFTDDWYLRAFDRPAAQGKRIGDITPEYSTIPEAGIRHLRRLLGAVRIIYLIREPVGRALSQLRMNVGRRGQGGLSTAEWLDMADQWDIANRGDYQTYVPRWKAHFAEADLLFLPYGRIAADPAGLMREVEGFLGLKPHDYPRIGERVHPSKRLSIPGAVVQHLEGRFAEQAAFLKEEFGAEFARLT
jgi:hypothetical protein